MDFLLAAGRPLRLSAEFKKGFGLICLGCSTFLAEIVSEKILNL